MKSKLCVLSVNPGRSSSRRAASGTVFAVNAADWSFMIIDPMTLTKTFIVNLEHEDGRAVATKEGFQSVEIGLDLKVDKSFTLSEYVDDQLYTTLHDVQKESLIRLEIANRKGLQPGDVITLQLNLYDVLHSRE